MTWDKTITELGKKHRKADKAFKADFIHKAFKGRLGEGQSEQLASLIEDAIDYMTDIRAYSGVNRKFYETLNPTGPIDFVKKYMKVSGLVEDSKERKKLTDAFLSAEEHVEFNTPVGQAMRAYEVKDPVKVETASTGIGHYDETPVTRIIDVEDGYSEEEIQELSNDKN